MKKLYEKNELTFAIVWIVVYCVLQSLANPLNKAIGVAYAASAAFCVVQTVVLFTFIRKNNLQKLYGLCKSPVPACRFLYYVPLLILASGNLWNSVALNYSPAATACRIVCMLCVGFLEEVIFRGLLFESIAKDNIKSVLFCVFEQTVKFWSAAVRAGIVVVAVYIVYLPALRVSVLSEQHLLVLYASAVRAIGLALILLGQPAVYGGPHILRLLLSICSHFSANSFLSGNRPFLNTLLHMGDFAKKQHLLYINIRVGCRL